MGASLVAGALSATVITGMALLPHLLRLVQWLCSLTVLIFGRQFTRYPNRQIIENTKADTTSTPV